MSAAPAVYLENAMTAVSRAIEHDRGGRPREAIADYIGAINWFQMVLKYEKNTKVTERVQTKMFEYLERAEQLKQQTIGPQATHHETTSSESKALEASLSGAILQETPNVSWSDVCGLEAAKRTLQEAVIIPLRFPNLFAEADVKPWKGILLYGPPGTGKTYLAKALATEARATFFCISSSDLVSKYVGETERLIKTLFAMARERKPSVIFIDEIDALCSARGDAAASSASGGEGRAKTEIMVQMEGVGKNQEDVLVLGATNVPWNLDAAIRRRFERRVYIPLPDADARRHMLADAAATGDDDDRLVTITEGYSGADIAVAIRGAKMEPIRFIQTATHFCKSPINPKAWMACEPDTPGSVRMTWNEIPRNDPLTLPPLKLDHFIASIQTTRPSVDPRDLQAYEAWTQEFGMSGQ